MPQIILGIDPGIGRTGYAFISKQSKNETSLLDYGCITTSTKLPVHQRLRTLFSKLTTLIQQYNPEVMVMEQLFFNTNVKTATVVGQAMGTILLAGAQSNLQIYQLTPLQIKIALTGYGRAEKQQVRKMVMTHLQLEQKPTPDDAADAIAAALSFALRNFELDTL